VPLVSGVHETTSELIVALLAPITPARPMGTFDEEDALYQRLDTEMAKLGGLRQSSLDWAQIERDAVEYLRSHAKHLRVLGHLITAWTRTGDAVAWTRSVQVLAGWVEGYWVDAYPRPGTSGLAAKRKQWAIVLDRLTQGLRSLRAGPLPPALHADAVAALKYLEQAAGQLGLDAAAVATLHGAFVRESDAAKQAVFAPSTPKPASPGAGKALGEEFFSTRSDLPLGDERETRKLFLKLAEFVNQQDAFDPTGYLLRRYGLWSHLHAAPPVKRERRTELMGVPLDVSAAYQDGLATRSTSPALLLRVEKSVASSPFWLRGSFLAARIAQHLEMEDVAIAIRMATHRFLLRLPRLRELSFADGTPFVDEDTFAWIAEQPVTATRGKTPSALPAGSLAALRAELGGDTDTLPVETLLQRLQRVQEDAVAPREQGLATVVAADVLAERGLAWLARDLQAGVLQTMDTTPACVWDRATYDYVKWRLRPKAGAVDPVAHLSPAGQHADESRER
jgi:type VI secretion system protein VasJ